MLAKLSHFFLPQESNNFRAKALHHSSLSSFFAFFLVFQLVISSFLLLKPAILGFAAQISPERVIELTNQERAKVGAPPLRLNPALSEAALRKAGDMFAFNYWAHFSPSGRSPWDFFKEAGYRFSFAGENLARDFANPEAVVSAWMASPTHRENILNPKYEEMGVAVIDGTLGGAETTLVVQFFGASVGGTVAQVPAKIQPPVQAATEKVMPIPTPTPTIEPLANPVSVQTLAQATPNKNTQSLVNPFILTRNLGMILFVSLAGILLVDGLITHRRKTFRLTGRTFAHALFLLGGIFILFLLPQGAIL